MPTLSVQTPRSKLAHRSERVIICVPDLEGVEQTREVPWAEIERIVVGEQVNLTTPLLCEAMRRGVPVSFVGWNGRFLGGVEPPPPARGATRALQYACANDSDFALEFARRLVLGKLHNSRRLLQRIDSNHHLLTQPELDHLGALHTGAGQASALDQLRGMEGAGAAAYFPLWARFLPNDFPFDRRSIRPPLNAVNAVLSYLSALVYGELLSACQTRGLDPAPGHLHTTSDDRFSLPLDLMEPFRPCVIEALALRLFSHRILRTEHFEARDGGIFLNATGRRTLHEHYEQRLMRQFFSEHARERTTLRRQIEDEPLLYKLALGDATRFVPFLMN